MQRGILVRLIVASVIGCLLLPGWELIAPEEASQAAAPLSPVLASQTQNDVVSAEGAVVPYKEADLGFKAAGRVQSILVSEGDVVTAGQELAKLETRDLEQAILQAQARLKSAKAELAKAKAGARPEEIATAKAALSIAQAGVKAAEGSVKVAQGNLEVAQADIEAAEGAVGVARGRLSATQAALSSTQADLNKLLAGATKREIEIAEKRVDRVGAQLWGLQRMRDEGVPGIEGEIAVTEERVRIAELELEKLKDPPRTEDVTMARARVSQAQANVQTARAELARTETGVTQAQTGVQIAEAQLAQVQAQVKSAEAQALKAQAELDLVEAGTRQEDIAVAEAAVAQAEATLAEAENALEDAILRAPFDGTVGAVLVDEGERVPAYLEVMRLGDLSQLRVETEDLSEVDIDQVAVGQEATITVDALGGTVFGGIVSRIAPIATDHRGDTVYTVTLDLGVGPESGLRWGMSTFVEIHVQ